MGGRGEFHLWEYPRSGSKAKDIKERERERREKNGNNNGQLRIANATSGGARKAAWANVKKLIIFLDLNIFYGS